MPTQVPTSFASAAAGNVNTEGSASGRGMGGNGDWSRPRPNGATQTFRRTSQTMSSSLTRDGNPPATMPSASGLYVPPHLHTGAQPSPRNSASTGTRYSKDQLLDIFRAQTEAGGLDGQLPHILTEGWSPGASNPTVNGWGRREETKEGQASAEVCWDYDGMVQPLGLIPFGDEEKELFSSSVNSPIKPPTQNPTKEGAAVPGLNGRKPSVSHGAGNVTPGQPSRPSVRRRDTADSLSQNPLSPTFSRAPKDEPPTPPASLMRRRTDYKESAPSPALAERPKLDTGADANTLFGSLKRTTTNPGSAGINGPSSPWTTAPSSSGFGAFGNFSLDSASGNPTTPGDKKFGLGSVRGESRFKGLMSKESSEDMGSKTRDRRMPSLEKLNESGNERKWNQERSLRPMSKESNLWAEPERVGSAALGGDEPKAATQVFQDASRMPNQSAFPAFGGQSEQQSLAELIGMREHGMQDAPQHHQYTIGNPQEPMSPTNTNPYQSPESDRRNADNDMNDESQAGFYGGSFASRSGVLPFDEGDRSQSSSTGAPRGFPAIGGLGGLAGLENASPWSAAPGAIGTPSRTTAGFPSIGDPRLGSLGDIQPPSGGGFAGMGAGGFGNFGRSKLGSLFPPQMQEQMRPGELGRMEHGPGEGLASRNVGGSSYGAPSRDTDSPSLQSRGVLDDLFDNSDRNRGPGPFSSEGTLPPISQPSAPSSMPQTFTATSTLAATPAATVTSNSGSFSGRTPEPESSSTTSSQLPPAQQRQMVMPDRMRWIYRDPQGNTQGPWSGLEMHDWYKAGFFSPELLVKKVEDNDYEPLAQLIRRIGNSREPFLVPQIGIPHGAATASSGQTALGLTSPGPPTGTAQPPFASSFPSFGTTLTADQQNALERRKQEEQYLMARQKEHLVQQQVFLKQMQMQGMSHGMNQQLHHHSSAHSLQSQPSYGSITSPTGYQPSPGQIPAQPPGPLPGFFDNQRRPGPGGPGLPPDAMQQPRDLDLNAAVDRMSLGRSGGPQFTGFGHGESDVHGHQHQVAAAMHDRAQLQKEQERFDASQRDSHNDGREAFERFEQFHQLRDQEGDSNLGPIGGVINQSKVEEPATDAHAFLDTMGGSKGNKHGRFPLTGKAEQEPLSLSQQQFPLQPVAAPAPSISPLPAPAAQRNRIHVADNLAAGSRSRTESPQQDTPTTALAPWAKESADQGPKGPSLKEIQEAEARKTAQQEEVLAAARRAQAEQERAMAAHAPAPAPGLPSSANWAAAGGSPVSATATSGPSAWAKPLAGKVPTSAGPVKKTLAQIQKEEEARKTRAAAASAVSGASASAAAGSGVPVGPTGKRYADLAGKSPAPIPGAISGNAWTTVGAGGKAKTPVTATSAPAATRTVSGGASANVAIQATKPKPAAPARVPATGATSAAQDEFHKWIKSALGKGLTSTDLSIDEFTDYLLQLPTERDVLAEAIYGSSQTLDGHRLADEFVRRRRLADKGVMTPPDPSLTAGSTGASGSASAGAEGKGGSGSGGGGWNEVAKRVPSGQHHKEEGSSSFKVVAAKKKGKR